MVPAVPGWPHPPRRFSATSVTCPGSHGQYCRWPHHCRHCLGFNARIFNNSCINSILPPTPPTSRTSRTSPAYIASLASPCLTYTPFLTCTILSPVPGVQPAGLPGLCQLRGAGEDRGHRGGRQEAQEGLRPGGYTGDVGGTEGGRCDAVKGRWQFMTTE